MRQGMDDRLSPHRLESMNEELAERVEYFKTLTYNCAQTSFAALRDVFGLQDGGIFKAMTPFPGFCRGEICGAVTGCVMVFGLLFGTTEEGLKAGKKFQSATECTREFCDRFAEHHSSLRCWEIRKHKLGSANAPENPVEATEWTSRMVRECTGLVHDAVSIAAAVIVAHGNVPRRETRGSNGDG